MYIFRYMKKNYAIVLLFGVLWVHGNELLFLDNLREAVAIDDQMFGMLAQQAKNRLPYKYIHYNVPNAPLFEQYPMLQDRISYISLGSFPTPIKRLTELERMYHVDNLFIKQDGMSGGKAAQGITLFGGNKVRKLEFLLADALHYKAESILTFGGTGSNHAVATATYAQQLGLRCYIMLTPQPDSPIVQRNLGLMYSAGAKIIFSDNSAMRAIDTIEAFVASKKIYGDYPYFIPTGGSVVLGVLGFVNAAFELRRQIDEGLLPEPDCIYVATGSCGTTAGLALGLKAAKIRSRIVAVCIEPEGVPGAIERKIGTFYRQANQLLHTCDETFPLFTDEMDNVTIVHDFCGTGYGVSSLEAIQAIDDMSKYEGICLDETYTGKAFSALRAHAQKNLLSDKKVLFWNTFCSDMH